jgi:hypothetical protein
MYVLSNNDDDDLPDDDRLYLSLRSCSMTRTLIIVGESDCAILETALYILELEKEEVRSGDLELCTGSRLTLRPTCWSKLLDAVSSRFLEIKNTTLSVKLSQLLATKPLQLSILEDCYYEDGGTAFVNALERRRSIFDSLELSCDHFHDDNLKRLFRVDKIKHLEVRRVKDELILLPFSAQADSLKYSLLLSTLQGLEAHMHSVNFGTRKLELLLFHSGGPFPTSSFLSLLRRMAQFDHFAELTIDIMDRGRNLVPDSVVQELIRIVTANCGLQVFNLPNILSHPYWNAHTTTFFDGLRDHKGLRTFGVTVTDKVEAFGPDFIRLRHFLSYNRNITVTDGFRDVYTDGLLVDEIYALNRFYRESKTLVFVPQSERPLLVATALTRSASDHFQRSALLLADHADALLDLIQCSPNLTAKHFDAIHDLGHFES